MLNWLDANKQWLFSGFGGAIIITLLGWVGSKILRKKSDSADERQFIKSGDDSNNTQIGKISINVGNGEGKNDGK